MRSTRPDGSAGDVDYGVIGLDYSRYRRPDPEIAAAIRGALGDARRVINVGAGAGSYEPTDRDVTAVEPSASMRAQRPPTLTIAIDAMAEDLPFRDDQFDAGMSTLSVHQWRDLAAGLSELRRVTTGTIVIMTADPALLDRFWLVDYLPEAILTEASRYPPPPRIAELLGGRTEVRPVKIPLLCTDGFAEAYYGRPEKFLDQGAQRAMSAWSFIAPEVIEAFEKRLAADLASGRWDREHGALRTQPYFEGAGVLVVNEPD